MSENVLLKKVSCQNCGAGLVFDPQTQMTDCNFCGSKFEIELSIDEEILIPDGILPFKVQKEEYEKSILKWLSEGDYTPDDILNSSIFESVTGTYLPMWFFKGKYTGNWSASSGYNRREEYVTRDSNGKAVRKTRTVTDWRPSNGQLAGNYSILGFAGEGKGIASDISIYSESTGFKRGDLKNFDSKYLLGFNMVDFTSDEIDCWDKRGQSQVRRIGEQDAKNRIPGDKSKDFICDLMYDQDKSMRIYVPFWITNYQYNTKNFHVYMDGTSTLRIEGGRPVDENRKKEVKRKFLKGHISLALTILVFIVLANMNATEDEITVFGTVSVLITIVLYIIGNVQKKKIIRESKMRRDKILKGLNQ